MDAWKVNYGGATELGQLTLAQSEDGFYTALRDGEVLYIGESLLVAVDTVESVYKVIKAISDRRHSK